MQTLPSLLQSKRRLCNMHPSKGLCPEHDIKLLNYLTINTNKIHTIMKNLAYEAFLQDLKHELDNADYKASVELLNNDSYASVQW